MYITPADIISRTDLLPQSKIVYQVLYTLENTLTSKDRIGITRYKLALLAGMEQAEVDLAIEELSVARLVDDNSETANAYSICTLLATPAPDAPKASSNPRFKRPTREEVVAYWTEKGLHGDPEEMFDHYETTGWTIKSGEKVKNWQSAANNWSRRHDAMPRRMQAQAKAYAEAQYAARREEQERKESQYLRYEYK